MFVGVSFFTAHPNASGDRVRRGEEEEMSVDYAQLKLQHEYWCCGIVEYENEEGVKRVVRLPAAQVCFLSFKSFLCGCGVGRHAGKPLRVQSAPSFELVCTMCPHGQGRGFFVHRWLLFCTSIRARLSRLSFARACANACHGTRIRKPGVLAESTPFHPRLAACACMRLVLG